MLRPDSTGGLSSAEATDLQILVGDVRNEWRLLWRDRIDDKARAEGMASRNFELLFVERGTVIIATRDFKLLDLKEILRVHKIENAERFIPPHPSVGGWGKFARTMINTQRRVTRAQQLEEAVPRRVGRKKNLQLKKGGRGWLHRSSRK
ncbi:MAG TPA: hypothetical protein VJ249_11355 [Candidatus Bathyarchaeia archaeon]|nr:hypothetical protein [Candidatus Bathyarchaeia archaeon]